jgi:hypothetical protein
MLPIYKLYPLKTFLITALLLLFSFIPSAYSQSYFAQSSKGIASSHLNGNALPRVTNGGSYSANFFLDYYISDSIAYTATSFMNLQGQLINKYYNFPTDTTKSYKASSMFGMNYFCINAISVAFDTIVTGTTGYLEDTIGRALVDTIYVPIVQVNHSGRNDTLEIQLTTVDATGYPDYNTYLLDTMVVASSLGAGNDFTVKTIKWNLSSYVIPASRFAVNVTYRDPSKLDSCWFIYGYGDFTKSCSYEAGHTTFADISHFSKIKTTPKPFFANSFALFNQYAAYGDLPAKDGNNEFFPCTAVDTDHFIPGTDGANYLQDIDIAAYVTFISYAGVPDIHTSGISISQNYPNPFTSITTINYTLIKSANVSLTVKDIAGREILSENYGNMNPGQHSINLSASGLSPGVYFYSITCSGYTITKKMILY